MGSMTALGGYSSQSTLNNLHSVFGTADNNTPPLLDLSEFPSLTNRNSSDSMPQPSPMPGAKPYGKSIQFYSIGLYSAKYFYIFKFVYFISVYDLN